MSADTRSPEDDAGFPIVGIGASAGGLEAFLALFRALPATRAWRSSLCLTWRRHTPVRSPRFSPGPHQCRSKRSLLSGTATDGTLGLSAIKAEGGITFAQDDTAQQTGMPHSAIAEGSVDFVLSPPEIARELERIARHPRLAASNLDGTTFLPHIIFLDIAMPGMDGYQLARQLRERPELDHPLIVAVTGFGGDADRQLAHDAGFDEHATKPLDPAILSRLLARRRES